MRLMLISTLVLLTLPAVGQCAKPVLPDNVTLRDADKRQSYLDAIDFSYQAEHDLQFAAMKLCIAENISNNPVTIMDSAGSFVGPATGTYYSNDKSQTIAGGSVFKYVDDASSALVATGTADGGPAAWGLTRDILKFDLKAAVEGPRVTLKFSNILRAQQSTGSGVNDGFGPVGTWKGAKPLQVYSSLESIATKLKACL